MNFKNFLKKTFTFENLDKALNSIEKGFVTFQKGMNEFNKQMDSFSDGIKSHYEESDRNSKVRETRNKEHLKKLWGSDSSNVKIWSDKKSNESLF